MEYDFKEEMLIKKYMPNKEQIKDMSSFFYAFSDDTRLRIMILLLIKPMCVGDISSLLDINQTTISHQLKILKSLNIVGFDRAGKNIVYYISQNGIQNVFEESLNCI